ncbi:MAG: hypothetical protein LBQ43_02685 [Holosporales bacterium]|jgi:hypothetical protein|nr:hypothetical protein [Holosporales bacterium]
MKRNQEVRSFFVSMAVFAALANSTFAQVNETSAAETAAYAAAIARATDVAAMTNNTPTLDKYSNYRVLRAGSAPHHEKDSSHIAFVDGRYQNKLLAMGLSPRNVLHVYFEEPSVTDEEDWYSCLKADLRKVNLPRDPKHGNELVQIPGEFDLIITDTSSNKLFGYNWKEIAKLLKRSGRLIMTDTKTTVIAGHSLYTDTKEGEWVYDKTKKGSVPLEIKYFVTEKYPSWEDYMNTHPQDAEVINTFYNFSHGRYKSEHVSCFDYYSSETGIVVVERIG